MPVCWVGIGANIGEPRAAFELAWRLLAEDPRIKLLQRSGLYSTSPVGQHAGGTFTNGVFSVQTDLLPLALLDILQGIESEIGRTRTVRWGPRTIDLDLLYVDQQIVNEPRLTLPHPAAWYRKFVVEPLVEIASELQHPVLHESVRQLRDRLNHRPLMIAHLGPLPDGTTSAEFRQRFPVVHVFDGTKEPTIPAVYVRLQTDSMVGATKKGVPVADLTQTPGEPLQRLTDFLVSVLDTPNRIESW
ncbi:MAG: 2-amino-4-hydroxy-6-hydroxymethyldihydropteridine diphosphokinase [Planctomycetota bacterium]